MRSFGTDFESTTSRLEYPDRFFINSMKTTRLSAQITSKPTARQEFVSSGKKHEYSAENLHSGAFHDDSLMSWMSSIRLSGKYEARNRIKAGKSRICIVYLPL